MAQYDAPISQAEFQQNLEATSLSEQTKLTINNLIAPLGAQVVVNTWDGQAALPAGNQVLVVNPTTTTPGETVQLSLPAEQLASVKAWIFDTDANISANFNTIERVIVGGRGENTFTVAGDRDTTIVGGNATDKFTTSGGNDTFEVGTGDTTIAAGEGFDVVVAQGGIEDYDVAIVNGALVLTTKETGATIDAAKITAGDVEFVEFAKTRGGDLADTQSIAITDNAEAATVVRLYNGLLNRSAEAEGAKFWLSAEEQGVSLDAIAQAILNSNEFKEANADISNAAFVDLLYTQALQRAAGDSDTAGKSFWVGALEAGASREQVAVGIVGSLEATDKTSDHIIINDGTV